MIKAQFISPQSIESLLELRGVAGRSLILTKQEGGQLSIGLLQLVFSETLGCAPAYEP